MCCCVELVLVLCDMSVSIVSSSKLPAVKLELPEPCISKKGDAAHPAKKN